MNFTAGSRDANEGDIVKALRAVGAYVFLLNGKGVPDLLVGYRGSTFAIEVKNPNGKRKSNSKGDVRLKRGAFKPAQVKSFADWKGAPIHVVINIDEALGAIGAIGAMPLTREQVVDALEAGAKESNTSRMIRRTGRYF